MLGQSYGAFFWKKKSCFESAQFYFYWSVKQEQTFYPAKVKPTSKYDLGKRTKKKSEGQIW